MAPVPATDERERKGPVESVLRRPTRSERRAVVATPIQANVIYLGANPKKSVYYPGATETFQGEDGKDAWRMPENGSIETGETYIFEKYDTNHRLVRDRLTADGKVFVVCRNLDHLARFYEETDGEGAPVFELRASQGALKRIEEYIRRRNRMAERPDSPERVLADMGLKPVETG